MALLNLFLIWLGDNRNMKKIIFLFLLIFYSLHSQADSSGMSCQYVGGSADAMTINQDSATVLINQVVSYCGSVGGKIEFRSKGEPGVPNYWYVTGTYFCGRNCTCPSGKKLNTVLNASGYYVTSCVDDVPAELPDDDCDSGFPKFNGSCQVCFEYNLDGSCVNPAQCQSGEVNQGTLNGQAICQKTCSDPNQSYGVLNGVEGCYGAPTCPNPNDSFGSVNGVYGCYGSDGVNNGGNSGSGSSSGSNTSSGSGTSSGSNASSGSGTSSGSGASSGSGGNNNGDGSSGGNNNLAGLQYPEGQNCPQGFHKDGNFCVNGRGDCPVGHHALVVSATPFYYMCVKDNLPSSSSSSSISSSSSSKSSSSNSSTSNSSTSASGGGTSSGSGGTGGTGGNGSGGEEEGECDPTSADYLDCLTSDPSDLPTHITTESGYDSIDEINSNFTNRLTNSPVVQSFNKIKTIVTLSSPSCPSFSINIFNQEISTTIHCTLWATIAIVLSPIMIAVWSILAFRVFASA